MGSELTTQPQRFNFDRVKSRPPSFSIGKKLPDESDLMGRRSPWKHYSYDTNIYKTKRPAFTIGKKLPDESDLMSKRSPNKFYDYQTDVYGIGNQHVPSGRNCQISPI